MSPKHFHVSKEMEQQQNQCIIKLIQNGKVIIHVKRQGQQISECKLCIT